MISMSTPPSCPQTPHEPVTPPTALSDNLDFDLSTTPRQSQPTLAADEPKAPSRGGILGMLIVIGMFLMKFKSLLVFLKFGKFLPTAASMLLSVAAYSTLWGWKFATGFVLLIFVHEIGHVLAAWQKKLPVSAPMFIPFLGAMITLKENPRDAITEAYIGYGGPFLGAIGCTLTWGLFYLTGNYMFVAVASFSMMINLFNLIPVSPLDGGRIVTAISPRLWLLGLIGMGAWFLVSHNVIVLILVVLGAIRLWSQWKTMKTDEYFQISPTARLQTTLAYVALVAYLAWAHTFTHDFMQQWMHSSGINGRI